MTWQSRKFPRPIGENWRTCVLVSDYSFRWQLVDGQILILCREGKLATFEKDPHELVFNHLGKNRINDNAYSTLYKGNWPELIAICICKMDITKQIIWTCSLNPKQKPYSLSSSGPMSSDYCATDHLIQYLLSTHLLLFL